MIPDVENVSRETCALTERWYESRKDTLEAYADRLWWWNKKVNLVSRELPKEDLALHIRHSLFPAVLLKESPLSTWVDAGSGGGLPGVPLALLFPNLQFVLNDISPKKGVALRDTCHHLGLKNIRVEIGDIGSVVLNEPFGVVSKHAFKVGPLLDLLKGKPWVDLLLLKGADYVDDLLAVSDPSLAIKAYSLGRCDPTTFFTGKHLLHLCRKV